jgi:hypothetical protein
VSDGTRDLVKRLRDHRIYECAPIGCVRCDAANALEATLPKRATPEEIINAMRAPYTAADICRNLRNSGYEIVLRDEKHRCEILEPDDETLTAMRDADAAQAYGPSGMLAAVAVLRERMGEK